MVSVISAVIWTCPIYSLVIDSGSRDLNTMSTTNLPLELLGVIVVLCPKSAFPALCRTCKTFRDIIEPLLYHDICLSSHDVPRIAQADEIFHRIVSLYETLKSNREKASMVQKVEILELW